MGITVLCFVKAILSPIASLSPPLPALSRCPCPSVHLTLTADPFSLAESYPQAINVSPPNPVTCQIV